MLLCSTSSFSTASQKYSFCWLLPLTVRLLRSPSIGMSSCPATCITSTSDSTAHWMIWWCWRVPSFGIPLQSTAAMQPLESDSHPALIESALFAHQTVPCMQPEPNTLATNSMQDHCCLCQTAELCTVVESDVNTFTSWHQLDFNSTKRCKHTALNGIFVKLFKTCERKH